MTVDVQRAIIPCGGKGTRMARFTHGGAKELLPLRGEPALAYVLRECAASGVEDVLLVSAPGKDDLAAYGRQVAGTPGFPQRIDITIQEDARGLADAIRLGRTFASNDPVVVALPDNVFVDTLHPPVEQVIDTYRRRRVSVVGLTEIFAADAAKRGPTSIYEGRSDGPDFRITRIPPKGARGSTFDVGTAASAVTGVGRYVFTSDVFSTIDEVERQLSPHQELDDIPVLQILLAHHALIGRVLRGTFLDVGLPQGYEEALALFQ